MEVQLRMNGSAHLLALDPWVSPLGALREHLGLTGSRKGCNQGACGACTVLIDGERIVACQTLAVQCGDGGEITTIEGVGDEHSPPAPAGVRRARRLPVRLLHVGPELLGDRDAGRAPRARRAWSRRTWPPRPARPSRTGIRDRRTR